MTRPAAGQRFFLGLLTVVVLAGLTWASLGVVTMPDAVPVTAPTDQFSSARAWPHLETIAQGPSPTGSVANAAVHDYIVAQIKALGLAPELQSTVTIDRKTGSAYAVENILVRLKGKDGTRSVIIVGHYDGVASGPGAGDNHFVNAAMLEALRTLQNRPLLQNDVIFFFADAEEYGLVGAQAFVAEHPWARDIGVVLNYDASDGRGPLVLQQTAAEDGWLVRNLAAAHDGSFLKSQQNTERDNWGQDFDVFEDAGYTAANLNNWTNQAYYHTRLDNVANLDERKLQAYGVSMVQLAQHFGNIDLRETRAADRVFTSVFDKDFVVSYPRSWTWPLTILAVAGVAAVCWMGIRRRRLSLIALAKSTTAMLAFLILAAGLAEIAWQAIKGLHAEADWQQESDIYQGNLLFAGLVSLVAAAFIVFFTWAKERFGLPSLQLASLAIAAMVAVFGAAAYQFFSYVALWPVVAVTIAVATSQCIPEAETGRWAWLRAGVFWLAAVPVLGIFGPFFWHSLGHSTDSAAAIPVLFVSIGVMLLISLFDLILPSRRLWLSGLAVVLGVTMVAIGTVRSSFSADQPQPHTLFYALNTDTGAAKWGTMKGDADGWITQFVPIRTAQKTTADLVVGIPASSNRDFVWLPTDIPAWVADAPAITAPAPTVTILSDQRNADLRSVRLRLASPRGGRVVALAADQEVVSATVQGKPIKVYPGWRFVFVAPPAGGVELELVLRSTGSLRLTALDQSDGLPPSLASAYRPEPEDTMPAILPQWARGYPTFVTKTYVLE